ncbi:ABC transporter permease [Aestuariivirga sp.]|uniref:ABC transporter permease n=1 Tax=Aestuariivirga sp. TaxID=2650926 RepID=UPI0039E31722
MKGLRDLLAPALLGIFMLVAWEVACRAIPIPQVLLPAPSVIGAKIGGEVPLLAYDFFKTVLQAVIPGWIIGCGAGLAVALLCDRFSFLERGLLPLGNFFSVLPLVGVAPIMVMWFGTGVAPNIAVVVIMTFFPMLVNAIAGLQASSHLERDLMRSYNASWAQALLSLRLPAAMPFIFNALKINSTLAMIGAIVAEFFGTRIAGMGFRMQTGFGSMSLDLVWAEIAVAALTGSIFYALLVLAERAVTFWHPSYRT